MNLEAATQTNKTLPTDVPTENDVFFTNVLQPHQCRLKCWEISSLLPQRERDRYDVA